MTTMPSASLNPSGKPSANELRERFDFAPGAVTFGEWQRVPWVSRVVQGVAGDIAVVAAEAVLGFAVEGGGHANWVVIVLGLSDTVHVVPGCQVQTITFETAINNDEYAFVP